MYTMPPPNEDAVCLRDVRFGRQEYAAERAAYSKALFQFYSGETPHPPSWQPKSDPHAYWYIWNYLPGVHPAELVPPERYLALWTTAWHPDVFQQVLLTTPNVIQAVFCASQQVNQNFLPPLARKELTSAVMTCYFAGYKQVFVPVFPVETFTLETQFQWATKSMRLAAEFVAMWLVANVFAEETLWGSLFAEHVFMFNSTNTTNTDPTVTHYRQLLAAYQAEEERFGKFGPASLGPEKQPLKISFC